MARPRLGGGTSFDRTPSMKRSPPVISSSPAMSLNRVDLPQPDGPTKTQNSRSSIPSDTPLMMSKSPKDLRMLVSLTVAIARFLLLHGAKRQATHQLALAHPAEDEDGRDGHGRRCGELGPEEAFRARKRGDERQREREQQVVELLLRLRAIHAPRLQDLSWHFLEEGEEHPAHDGKVDQRIHDEEPGPGIEETQVAKDQVDGDEHADRRQRLGGEHPHQRVLGALGREERHGVSAWHRDRQRQQRRADRHDDAVPEELEIVGALLHRDVILDRGAEEDVRRHRDGIHLRLEAGEEHPEDGKEDDERDRPRGGGDDDLAAKGLVHGCQASMFFAIARTRNAATTLASTMARTPPADAAPTSYSSSA